MEDAETLKSMVTSFRVSELQKLLEFAGKNKHGRKMDLQVLSASRRCPLPSCPQLLFSPQKRALEVLELDTSDVKKKIRDLSAAMYRGMSSAASVNPYSPNYDADFLPSEDSNSSTTSSASSSYSRRTPSPTVAPPPPSRREVRMSTRESSRASSAAALAKKERKKDVKEKRKQQQDQTATEKPGTVR